MLNQISSIIFMTVAGTVQGIALEYMLETTNKTKKLFRIVYWTVLALIPSMINVFVPNAVATIALRNSVHWGMAVIAVIFFYSDPMWRRIVAVILVYFGMISSDLVFFITARITNFDVGFFLDKSNPIVTFFVGIAMSIAVITIFLMAFSWRKFLHKRSKISYLYCFIIYMINHMITFMIMETELWALNLDQSELMPVITSYLCEAALLVIIFSQSEKETMEEALAEEKQRIELEKIHYGEVRKRREELLAISQNNSNEIENIKKVLASKEYETAEGYLIRLLQKVENTREYPYCNIPIVNAVLSEKNKRCEELHIKISADIKLPEEINVQQMELCSIFSNLMDNAIRACGKISKMGEESEISLSAAVNGKYLIIKCENPAANEPGLSPEGTGLGLKILKDIAERYDGNLQAGFYEGIFRTQLSLRI